MRKKMKTRYGKASSVLFEQKQSFFLENEQHLARQEHYRNIYVSQPRRTICMCCDGQLQDVSFSKQGIDYLTCPQCGHLNGGHQDTDEFCNAVYCDDGGKSYAEYYLSKDQVAYDSRVKGLYTPKVDFLFDALSSVNINPEETSFADLGAGSGYFISALQKRGIENVRGYEISETQVEYANNILDGEPLVVMDTLNAVPLITAEVISMIGVLEHLQNPRAILDALKSNPNIHFIFISVPLFSPTVFFEMIFSNVMHRHLACTHTHLYTPSSLEWLYKEFDFKVIAEWWFGTDIFDLMRDVSVTLSSNPDTESMADIWQELLLPLIDPLQLELDRKHLSSEVHVVLQVRR